MSDVNGRLKHLEWAIRSRYNDQKVCLKLLTLFEGHTAFWKSQKNSRAAQELTAVAFSLWRAAFLAEKEGGRMLVLDSAKKFLGSRDKVLRIT
jgi:hypothetical protein